MSDDNNPSHNEIECFDPECGYWEDWDRIPYSTFARAYEEVERCAKEHPDLDWRIVTVGRIVVWKRFT